MLGKASEIKTQLVIEDAGKPFDVTLERALKELDNAEVISIQFKATTDTEGVAWFSALIIYKEYHEFTDPFEELNI